MTYFYNSCHLGEGLRYVIM